MASHRVRGHGSPCSSPEDRPPSSWPCPRTHWAGGRHMDGEMSWKSLESKSCPGVSRWTHHFLNGGRAFGAQTQSLFPAHHLALAGLGRSRPLANHVLTRTHTHTHTLRFNVGATGKQIESSLAIDDSKFLASVPVYGWEISEKMSSGTAHLWHSVCYYKCIFVLTYFSSLHY